MNSFRCQLAHPEEAVVRAGSQTSGLPLRLCLGQEGQGSKTWKC